MMLKYAALVLVAVAAATALAVDSQTPTALPAKSSADVPVWTEVLECYKKPRAAIGCLESRMGRAVAAMRESAVSMARSDPDAASEDVSGVGDLVQQIGEFITYGISSYFRNGGDDDDDAVAAAASGSTAQVVSDIGDEGE